MPILNLGVIDLPYSNHPVTTGDVAGWLERRYHVVEHFWQLKKDKIADRCADAMRGAIDSLLMGAPPQANPLAGAMSGIGDDFRQMLARKELDRLGYPGIPTAASLAGVSHRFKKPHAKRPPRPSFIDTWLYAASSRAWVDNDEPKA